MLFFKSEQLDDELRNALKIYRTARQPTITNILKNLMDLCRYLPHDYIQSSFLMLLKTRLHELYNNFTREKYLFFFSLVLISSNFILDVKNF